MKPLRRLHSETEKWRAMYNPLRGLSIQAAVCHLEAYRQGRMTDLQWLYLAIEEADEILFSLLERRASALLELDWTVKTVPEKELPPGASVKLAEEQRIVLRSAYDRIDNLAEACEFLALATFRGFSHLHKQDRNGDGLIDHLEPLYQWNWVRDGLDGEWYWNPKARSVTADALKHEPESQINPEEFLIRVKHRHVDRIALISFIRKNLGEKDWTAFTEIYGIPSGVVTMPPNVPEGQKDEYLQLGKDVAAGGTGVLPSGGAYTANDVPRGRSDPFKEFIRHQQEKIVLCGTGGLLTMLTESGSGTLAGGAHEETFAKIAKAEAKVISEVFQRQFDALILRESFPDQPVLAYWELCANEEADTGEIVESAQKLGSAGYQIDPAQLSEKTGYAITIKPTPPPTPPVNALPIRNRAPFQGMETFRKAFAEGVAEDLKPVAARLAEIERMSDQGEQRAALEALMKELPKHREASNKNSKAAEALQAALLEGLSRGVKQARKEEINTTPRERSGG